MKDLIKKILFLFSKKEKLRFLLIFVMIIIAAVLETLGIGLIVPFVEIVMNSSSLSDNQILMSAYELFSFQSTNDFLIFSAIVLLSVFILKNIYLLFFQYVQSLVILNQQNQLSVRLFKSYITKPYTFHLQRNSANLLRNINNEVPRVIYGIILSGFQLLTELLVIACIFILLITIAPIPTAISSITLGGSVFLFNKIFRKKIRALGKESQAVSGNMIKWINQGLGASKEIKVMGNERFFVQSYLKESLRNARINRFRLMLEQSPKFFLEVMIISVILGTLLIIILQGKNTSNVVSMMALFAMAAFRLMPSLTRVMALVNGIRFNRPAVDTLYEDLILDTHKGMIKSEESSKNGTETIGNRERIYQKGIELKNVSFRYPEQTNYSIKNVSLSIPIGQSVAFIGESGAGKTTLVDLILGVLEPESGQILVDDISINQQINIWQRKIGYIPQTIYLSDDSIRSNVAFGVDPKNIDDTEVWRSLEQAKLKEFVESLPGKLDSFVGERGVRLSGGQRQRIGIARALYNNPEILVMDEATSALDNETEQEIMKAIDGLKEEKTILIIAHRLTTIENCDIIFQISKGQLKESVYKTKDAYSAV
ncbi:ABC transporter ATP-binding protein/permease [Caldibacillus lycopersici]|uniref:ABC transporter ATP-binding protein/permease n=1 Tax=Perspicuibacillus lycopersici TaxID=1325689 RepID=A0AAE3IPQ7_9BACI|nr:ABC transporter ATP-binding protein [Perspicuibacillus lycopersici]MCU9612320.1 ABC transporter ATP-binding protein/permease [Perspicuibacillus lycopersici]